MEKVEIARVISLAIWILTEEDRTPALTPALSPRRGRIVGRGCDAGTKGQRTVLAVNDAAAVLPRETPEVR